MAGALQSAGYVVETHAQFPGYRLAVSSPDGQPPSLSDLQQALRALGLDLTGGE